MKVKYIPSLTNIYQGILIIGIGAMLLDGGGFAVQIGAEQKPIWVNIPQLNTPLDWLVCNMVWR